MKLLSTYPHARARHIVVSRNSLIIILTSERHVISTEFVADFAEIAGNPAEKDLTDYLILK